MPRLKRAPVTREAIAAAALDLLDREGPVGLTMRALAHRLGVRAPSLYNHISGQDEIVNLIHELVDAEIDLATLDDDDLAQGLAAFARSYRAAYQRHPHALPLVVRRPIVSPIALQVYDCAATALLRHGVSAADVMRLLAMLDHLVLGATVDTFTAGFATDARLYRDAHPGLAVMVAGADFDTVDDTAFERGLDLFVAEVVGQVAAAQRARVMAEPTGAAGGGSRGAARRATSPGSAPRRSRSDGGATRPSRRS